MDKLEFIDTIAPQMKKLLYNVYKTQLILGKDDIVSGMKPRMCASH